MTKSDFDKWYVAIGTKNPIKVKSVKNAFRSLFKGKNIFFESISVNSEVGDQPIGLNNTIAGAVNRAKKAHTLLSEMKNEVIRENIFGVGIEAGLIPIKESYSKYLDIQFCAIYHKNQITIGAGSAFEYPKLVIDKIESLEYKEIGDVFGEMTNNVNNKFEVGAIGFLTDQMITREDILSNGVFMALIPWFKQDLYFKF